jgi:activator of HSP90 ATPase
MKTILQKHYVNATPEEVYAAITNPFTIELWSGYPAIMEAKEGFEFSIFDGDINGKNIKLVQDKEVVQEWYLGDHPEESIVTMHMSAHQLGTKINLEHTNVPDEDLVEFEEGWRLYYWGAIKEFFK